ncbi:MAG: TraB/GumN family protein [Candidatus Woesearchaeota archaeon]
MTKYKNIALIGTSHISKESIKKVKKSIKTLKPEIIALELDPLRFNTLLTKKKKRRISFQGLGFKAFLFNLLGAYIEKSLSKHTGVLPGTEMKTAIKIAKKQRIKIALIDQPIGITLKRLMSKITWKEKRQFVKDLFLGFFFRKKRIQFDLNKVPSEEIIEKLMEETEKNYPNIYTVLVTERNHYMGKALYKLMHTFPDKQILAIIGAGHIKGILGELKSIKK